MADEKRPQLRFILEGFVPDQEFRLFNFQAVETRISGSTVERTAFTVRTDLSLIRQYGIHVQELPLLCRELLERRSVSEAERHLILTEEDMQALQSARVAAEAISKKKYRRTPREHTGHRWGSTSPLNMEKHA
ncbi:MAG: hypothetical protein RL328_2743 [Acidobacteriota bacterium]|jgi:hypothetical protein